jgi:peptide-methionine (S)-S-oxide reductase
MRVLVFMLLCCMTAGAYAATQTLIVAGGCFWCVESDFEKHKGVLKAESGYINGYIKNPTYRQVASKKTGHYEAVEITYDDTQTNLEVFEHSLGQLNKTKPFEAPIVTEILEAQKFYKAEDYHQDYYKTHSLRYRYYRASCGRDARIEKLWGEVVSKKH